MEARGAMLSANNLKKDFGFTHALRNFSISCAAGTVHTIFGENGSGKTTFVKILSGILRPTGGEVQINGTMVDRFEPHLAQEYGVATVFQEILVAPARSVFDNLFLGHDRLFRFGRKVERTSRRQTATDVLSRISNQCIDLDRPAGNCSLSAQQLIVIARALLRNPSILLLDEPTSALDIDGRTLLFRTMKEFVGQGKLIIFISHRIDEVMELSDFVTVLNSGWSMETIPRNLLNPSKLLEAVLKEPSDNDGKDRR